MFRSIAHAYADYRRESAELEAIYDRRDRAIIADLLRESESAPIEGNAS